MERYLRSLIWLAAIFGAIGLLLYLFVFDTWVVPGDDPQFVASVEPNLRPNDRILTRRGSSPRYGELARCLSPDGSGRFVVGRMFGAGGDTVTISNERVAVNGKGMATRFGCGMVSVLNPATGQPVLMGCSAEDNGAFTYNVLVHPEFREGDRTVLVDPGKAYLVSDDRHIHHDSRDYGEVDAATCEHIVFRLWGDSFVDASRRFNVLW